MKLLLHYIFCMKIIEIYSHKSKEVKMKRGVLVVSIASVLFSANSTDNQIRVERAVGDQSVVKEAWGPENGWSESELWLFSSDASTITSVQYLQQSKVERDWYKQVESMPFSYGNDSTSFSQGVLKRSNSKCEDKLLFMVSHPFLEVIYSNFPAGPKEYTFDNENLKSITSNGVSIMEYVYSDIPGEEGRLLSGTYLDMFDQTVPFSFTYNGNEIVEVKKRSTSFAASEGDYTTTYYVYNSDNQVLSTVTTEHDSYGVDTLNKVTYQYDSTWSGVTETKITYTKHWDSEGTEYVSDSLVNSYDENGYEVYWRRVQRRDPETIIFNARGTKEYFGNGSMKNDIYEIKTDSTDWEVYYSRSMTRIDNDVTVIDIYNYHFNQPDKEKIYSRNEWDYYPNGWPSVCRIYSRSEMDAEYTLSSTDSINYGGEPVAMESNISIVDNSFEMNQIGSKIEWSFPNVSNNSLKLFSTQGREVAEVTPSSSGKYNYSTMLMAPGVYLFSVESLSGVHSGRFIVR